MFDTEKQNKPERVILVGAALNRTTREDAEYSLDELSRLTDTAGGKVIGRFIQKRPRPDSAYYIGRGMVDQIKEAAVEDEADLVIFDNSLSPNQMKNLANRLDLQIIDRAMLILDIFALHARSAESRLQVDLAQMEYLLPRLTGLWEHFTRQRGGIGTKGPGETQLEVDRRQIRQKISNLKKRLKKIESQRKIQRQKRADFRKIALVGYTNAGKSTLFNRLTRSKVTEANKLFSTLDSTTRMMSSEYSQKIVLTDTVGFIEKLPHQLVASFKSTLEEVKLADLILLVVDSQDQYRDRKIDVVKAVLKEIGAAKVPYLTVFNKIDLLDSEEIPSPSNDGMVSISALKGVGLDRLRGEILVRFE